MKMQIKHKKFILVTFIISNIVDQPSPEIIIEQGTVRGLVSRNGEFFEYLGIPYAAVNESNRFQAPLPPPNWEGVFEATNANSACPQKMFGISIGHEDCLKINVYTPKYASQSEPLPVMVFIHGGGFTEGSANKMIYGPDFFIRHGVILVTLNYRLGAFGFLCLGIEEAPGNAGLKDQLAALQWVRKNIRAFGGDPDNVTLFGESAGSASVSFHNLNLKSKGLYKRVIMQSGSSLGPWALSDNPIGAASKVASGLGFNTSDPYELSKIFKDTKLEQLIEITHDVAGCSRFDQFMFVPCVEKDIPGIEHIIIDSPFNILTSGKYNNVPSLIGVNDMEGLLFANLETETCLTEINERGFIPINFKFKSDEEKQNITEQVRNNYFKENVINKTTILKLAEIYGDVYFNLPSYNEAMLYSKNSYRTLHNYLFKYSGYRNFLKIFSGSTKEPGATHADELFYMFNSFIPFWPSGQDKVIIDRMTTMWTSYAKYGDPTPNTTELVPIKWIPSEANALQYLTIDRTLAMGPIPRQEALEYWDTLYQLFRRKIYTW